MSLKGIMYFIAIVIFLMSGSFVSGVQNSFTFLFWCHFIVLIPIIIVWFMLQVFGLSIALSPIFSSLLGGSAMIVGGWLLLAYFGINAALTYFISESSMVTNSALLLPISTHNTQKNILKNRTPRQQMMK
jgi:signal transduction histidine kinase